MLNVTPVESCSPKKVNQTSEPINHRKRFRYQSSLSFLLNNIRQEEPTTKEDNTTVISLDEKMLKDDIKGSYNRPASPKSVLLDNINNMHEGPVHMYRPGMHCSRPASPVLPDNTVKIDVDVENNSSVTAPSNDTIDLDIKCRFKLKSPILKKTTQSVYLNHPNNYLKGCKFSPDGLAILSCSNDNILRFYGVPDISSPSEQTPTIYHQMSGLIYDYCWSPRTNHFQPETCNILATSKHNPVHLIDGFTGKVKSSYKTFDKTDELTSAFSVAFSTDCSKVLAGFCKEIRVFDVNQPGRDSTSMVVSVEGLNNNSIVSTIVPHPTTHGVYGAGCYNCYVSLYSENVCGPIACFEGPQHGVTQLMFSEEGSKLFCGSRMENDIYCFDTRWTNKVLYTLTREVSTNQRIYFDIDSTSSVLVSGNHSGDVTMYDLTSPLAPPVSFIAHNDTCNGVSLHPYWSLLGTTSGRRHCHVGGQEEEENTLKIWCFSE